MKKKGIWGHPHRRELKGTFGGVGPGDREGREGASLLDYTSLLAKRENV